MTKQDELRRTKTINALLKAKECLEREDLYLLYSGVPSEEWRVHDALEHVGIALDRLTEVNDRVEARAAIC